MRNEGSALDADFPYGSSGPGESGSEDDENATETFDEIRFGCWDSHQSETAFSLPGSDSYLWAPASPYQVLTECIVPKGKDHGQVPVLPSSLADQPAGKRIEQAKSSGNDYETVFTNAKAGMDDVDKEYVKKVVFEMSKDSNFYKNEQRKGEEAEKRINALKEKLHSLTAAELENAEKLADRFMSEAEASQDLSRTFIHVDMDMFFAAVSQLHRPELEKIPFAIGGLGMISTANYVARKYGVRSAMPGFIGKHFATSL